MMACNPQNRLFCDFFAVFWTLFQSYPRVIRNGKDGIAAEPGLTDRVRTPQSVKRGRASHARNSDARERRPVLASLFLEARVAQQGMDADDPLAHHRHEGDLVRLAAVPQALVEGDHVGIVERCREGGHVEHGAGSVAAAPDMSGSLELSAVCGEGRDTDQGRALPVGQGPPFAHRGQDRAMSAAAVIRSDPTHTP